MEGEQAGEWEHRAAESHSNTVNPRPQIQASEGVGVPGG